MTGCHLFELDGSPFFLFASEENDMPGMVSICLTKLALDASPSHVGEDALPTSPERLSEEQSALQSFFSKSDHRKVNLFVDGLVRLEE